MAASVESTSKLSSSMPVSAGTSESLFICDLACVSTLCRVIPL
jgi:hypothetical protein